MRDWFVDLHVHIGRTESGQPVKISAARNLTFFHIAQEASERKGIDCVGIIDCQSPPVQDEMMDLLDRGWMEELEGGGLRYGQTTVLLGAELEVRDDGLGPAHLLAYLPTLTAMRQFTETISKYMKNVSLSSQRVYMPARDLQAEVIGRGGFLIPAHVFTPHKGMYGNCCDRMEQLLDPQDVAAIELGLSADSLMAGLISELTPFTFVTNSDAHSLAKIGREYNQMRMEQPSFQEVRQALLRQNGRAVTANYGLSPQLGKYHRTYCLSCKHVWDTDDAHVERCPSCGSHSLTRGVLDRIQEIADLAEPLIPEHRPPYVEQIPLEFIPGLGAKTLNKLLDHFGTEMNILHRVSLSQLTEVVPENIALAIDAARTGQTKITSGGGGIYGKVKL